MSNQVPNNFSQKRKIPILRSERSVAIPTDPSLIRTTTVLKKVLVRQKILIMSKSKTMLLKQIMLLKQRLILSQMMLQKLVKTLTRQNNQTLPIRLESMMIRNQT